MTTRARLNQSCKTCFASSASSAAVGAAGLPASGFKPSAARMRLVSSTVAAAESLTLAPSALCKLIEVVCNKHERDKKKTKTTTEDTHQQQND